MTDAWITLGAVARPHGIRGGLKLKLFNTDSEALRPGVVVRVGDREWTIARVYGADLVDLEGLADRNVCETMRGLEVSLRRADLPALDEDEVYLADFVGVRVEDTNGVVLGTIRSFTDNGAQPVAEVDTGAGIVSVPFVPPIVQAVEDDRIVLAPPGGLFDDEDLRS